MTPLCRLVIRVLAVPLLICFSSQARAQGTDARVTGIVTDPSKAVIRGARVIAINSNAGLHYPATTNGSGIYSLAALPIGQYRLEVESNGFKSVVMPGITLHVQDVDEINFELAVGSTSETVTVNGDSVNLNTTNATVSTVIDRELIENMPLNGKDLTTLFELSPGTLLNASGGTVAGGGGFSVNGQRPTANYLTVDGASGNAYIPISSGGNVTGAAISISASGGTNGTLPIDAIEEYRMDTSTYTAENGRTPGGQIQVRTRSGTNEFHGTLFENFRNQVLDATDWFVKYNNLKQSQLRLNDFGGTLGGPIVKNRLFFFVANDNLILDQPNTISRQDVPDSSLVQVAYPAFKSFLTAFPNGNGGPDPSNPGFDFFSASFPFLIRDHTTSVRLDAQPRKSLNAFFRANIAPSSASLPGIQSQTTQIDIYTYTGGVTVRLAAHLLDELVVNYTRTDGKFAYGTSALNGSDPNAIISNLPTGVNASADYFEFGTLAGNPNGLFVGSGPSSLHSLSQWNVVDDLSWQLKKHSLKVGIDVLAKQATLKSYANYYLVATAGETKPPFTSLQQGTISYLQYSHYNEQPVISVDNWSLFGNDSWHLIPSLTLNLGARWEYNPAPKVGPLGTLAPQGSLSQLSTLSGIVSNQPIYNVNYGNVAPRFGFAWSLPGSRHNSTVLRGGIGIYYDTGQASTAAQAAAQGYPYFSSSNPPTPVAYQSINWSSLAGTPRALPVSTLYFVDPSLTAPLTYQWSVTLEQEVGRYTKLSTSYVANDGEQLVNQSEIHNGVGSTGQYPVNTALVAKNGNLFIIGNHSHSNYQSLQAQMNSRVGAHLDFLTSYTWAHAEDNGSTEFSSVGAAASNPLTDSGNDIRHMFAAAIHYSPSAVSSNRVMQALTGGWAVDTIARLQTASPLTVTASNANPTAFLANADIVPGQPVVLHQHIDSFGKVVPGNKKLNHAAFITPPSSGGSPLRQGNSPTNGYRLFGLTQWDVAVSRSWKLWEALNLNFRLDAYNVLNTPNFASSNYAWSASNTSTFGRASNTYASFYGSTPSQLGESGSQLSVFQNGGPRELQLSMKLKF